MQIAQENNRYFGRLFKRGASGHLLNMHYLDNIFEMKDVDPEDRSKGKVKDGNEFMDSQADIEVYERFDTVQALDNRALPPPSGLRRTGPARKQIKELSRLWSYRNGGTPAD